MLPNKLRNLQAPAGLIWHVQTWPNMVRVWHMFYPELTEAREARDEIHKVLAEVG